RYFPFVGGMVSSVLSTFSLPMPAGYMSRFAWGNEAIDVRLFDTPKEQYGKTFTLVAGEHGTYVLNDPDGIAILNGKVGAEVTGASSLGPVRLKVDKLVGAPGAQFELQRASTRGTIDALQKRLTVAETALQSGIISVSLEGGDSRQTAAIV